MDTRDIDKLRRLTSFEAVVNYLAEELDWPIEADYADEIAFDYRPEELGIDPRHAVKIESIKQIRPLAAGQPWGVFYIEFEAKRLPVLVLRRILRSLVPTTRKRNPNQPTWNLENLLFISSQGEANYRSVSFAHFRQYEKGGKAELRAFSWDANETHFHYLKNLNLDQLRWPDNEHDTLAWHEQWSNAFTTTHRYSIKRSQALAQTMAAHARTVRDLVREVYDLEAANGPLHRLFNNFQIVLLHDLEPDTFSDMVAQTVAYGLFSAAIQDHARLTYDSVVELIPNTNPFLKDLLAELIRSGGIDLEELGIDQLLDLFRQTDMEAITHDFGRQTGQGREDPIVHFYELFLSEYDKTQKVERGVFYTPDPVVSYIVRSVDYLLRTEFGLEDGLADTSIDPNTGEPIVQVLDPATGTGTFLAHVIDVVEQTVKAKRGVDWNKYVARHLLPRLNGFELMMAPYAVGHMKLGLKLLQTGYDFSGDERLHVYLTNTLTKAEFASGKFAGFLDKESDSAAQVKASRSITVIVGNPPYSGHSMNKDVWIDGPLRDYYEVDGEPLGERNPKWLQDDYVKFIRFAQWRLEQTGYGILAFITNHGYLDGSTFRGMRQQLCDFFDIIYILDLHGSTKKKEVSPDGSPDKNVFDIMPGVAIGIFIKHGKLSQKRVYHADLWGKRQDKYLTLSNQAVGEIAWNRLNPNTPYYLLVPQNIDIRSEYNMGEEINRIFPVNSLGVATARDNLTIQFSRQEMHNIARDFASLPAEIAREKYRLGVDVRDWKVTLAQKDLRENGVAKENLTSILYRPFDFRSTFYTGKTRGFMCMPRYTVMKHMLRGRNLAFMTSRGIEVERLFDQAFCTRELIQLHTLSIKEVNTLFPIYLYPDNLLDTWGWPTSQYGRQPNLDREFVSKLAAKLGLDFVTDGHGDLRGLFGPEDIFHYTYAVFYSPTYRTRYAEFLKIDFPRLPYTSNRELFAALCALGADLVALHLLEDDYEAASWNQAGRPSPLARPITTFVNGSNGRTMGNFSKGNVYEAGRVYLDTSNRSTCSYFDGVPEDVWNFHIGGYQVLYKWLYDRRGSGGEPGRTLTDEDIAHYHRIVLALRETIRLMAEIDAAIDAHGGWPIE